MPMIRMYRTPFALSSWERSAYPGEKRTSRCHSVSGMSGRAIIAVYLGPAATNHICIRLLVGMQLQLTSFRARMNPPQGRICAALLPMSRPKVMSGAKHRCFSCPVIYDFASPLSAFSQVFLHRRHHRNPLQTRSMLLLSQALRQLPRNANACRDPASRHPTVSTGSIVRTVIVNAGF